MQTTNKTEEQEEYKETELGLLPKEWEVVRLGDIMVPDRKKINRDDYKGNIQIVQKISFDTGEIVFRDKRKTHSDLYVADKDHLITSKINFHQGAIAVTDRPTAATTVYEFYRVLEKADIFYLWRYFRTETFKHIFAQEIKFMGFKKQANFNFIKDFKIPLPPLQEQKSIAFVLSTIQTAKEKTEQVIKATKELKKSMMKHLFTYGPVSLEEAEKIKLKETEIGMMPKEWEVVRLGDVAEKMKAGGTPRRGIKEYWKGNIPFVLIEDMTSCGLYLSKTNETITEKGLKNSSAWLVPKNSLLLSMYATIGETAVNTIPLTTNQAILAIIPKNNFDAIFGAYLLKFSAYRLKMQNIQSTQKNVNKGVVENFKIPLPPLPTQQKIASILSPIDEKIQAEENKKKALENLFKSMIHNLMTAKIRVKDLNLEVENV